MIKEETGQKYYLFLNKTYTDEDFTYLNYWKDDIILSEKIQTDVVQTQFTNTEIKALIDEFGADIMDFERIPVED